MSPAALGALTKISVPACILDLAGIVQWQNVAAIELFGDHTGLHFANGVAADGAMVARQAFARVIFGRVAVASFDSVLLARGGRRVHAEVELAQLEQSGRAVGVLKFVTNEKVLDPDGARRAHLTPRQVQVLKLLADGRSTADIAGELFLSTETVRNHVRAILRALHAHSRVEALARARELGIL